MKRYVFIALVGLMVVTTMQPTSAGITTRSIDYSHDGTSLRGYLAKPDELETPQPGVMIVHQWMGLGDYEKMRARKLARLGFIAFAVDVYGADTRPETTHEASMTSATFRKNRNLFRRRLAHALNMMKSWDQVQSEDVAAIGYCFGGTGVLELARSGANLDAVVSFHGGLTTPNPKDASMIKAKVQVHHGGNDPHVTQEDLVSFWDEMKDHATVDWDISIYSDAPHGFTEPGTDAYDERADKLSWNSMKHLFQDVFESK